MVNITNQWILCHYFTDSFIIKQIKTNFNDLYWPPTWLLRLWPSPKFVPRCVLGQCFLNQVSLQSPFIQKSYRRHRKVNQNFGMGWGLRFDSDNALWKSILIINPNNLYLSSLSSLSHLKLTPIFTFPLVVICSINRGAGLRHNLSRTYDEAIWKVPRWLPCDFIANPSVNKSVGMMMRPG